MNMGIGINILSMSMCPCVDSTQEFTKFLRESSSKVSLSFSSQYFSFMSLHHPAYSSSASSITHLH